MVGAIPPSSSPLEKFRVGEVPTIFYVPDFITAAEEASLLQDVQGAPVAKWKTLKNRRLQNWGGVVHEKGLISQPIPAWLKSVTEKITKETNLFPAPINHVLVNEYLPGQGITSHQDGPVYYPVVAILSLGAPTLMRFTPHVRLAEANKDENPDGSPETSQITEGVRKHPVQATCSLALMPRSLLIFKDSAYTEYLHGIDEAHKDLLDNKVANLDAYLSHERIRNEEIAEGSRFGEGVAGDKNTLRRTGTRVSLTCRHVPKVFKNFLKL